MMENLRFGNIHHHTLREITELLEVSESCSRRRPQPPLPPEHALPSLECNRITQTYLLLLLFKFYCRATTLVLTPTTFRLNE